MTGFKSPASLGTVISGVLLAAIGLQSGHAYEYGDYSVVEEAGWSEPQRVADRSNYMDIRVVYYLVNDAEWEGNDGESDYASNEFDDASRISVMAIGPVCSFIPVNCFTPADLPDDSVPSGYTSWGDPTGFDWIGGLEISYNTWEEDANNDVTDGTLTPGVDVTAIALTAHIFGLAFETVIGNAGRIQFEATPFIGVGWATADWDERVGNDSFDDSGIYYEYGLRAGLYYTMPFGLQIGLDARFQGSEADVDIDEVEGENFSQSGILIGLGAGFRY